MATPTPTTQDMLRDFLRLAELGVTAEEYALANGDPHGELLEHACQGQWQLSAHEVASRTLSGSPLNLLTGLLRKIDCGDVQALKLAFDYRSSKRALDTRPQMSDADLVREARELLAKIEADPEMQLRLVKP